MIMVFGIDIGTLSFFVFSFIAGVFIFLQVIFGCKKETNLHRVIRGAIGLAYAIVTVYAFMNLNVMQDKKAQPDEDQGGKVTSYY